MLFIHLTRRRIVTAAAVLAVINVGLLWGTHLVRVFWRDDHWWPALYLGRQIDLVRENNAAVWYASMVLFAVSLAMIACFAIDRRRAGTAGERLLAYGWLIGAAMFALLSLDEAGSLHERINSVVSTLGVPDGLRVDSPGWVGVLAIPIALAGALLLAFAWFRVRRDPVAFGLMSAGTLLFLSVPVQEHLEVTRWIASGAGGAERSSSAALAEEGSELFGALCFLVAAAWYACGRTVQRNADGLEPCRIELPSEQASILPALTLLGAGLLTVEIVLPEVMNVRTDDRRGIPHNWFPAALALLVAGASVLLAKRHHEGGRLGPAAAFLLFGIVHLVLSIDHGSDHEYTRDLFSEFPQRRLVVDLLLIATLATAAIVLARTSSVPGIGLVAALWFALAIAPFWAGASLRPAFGFIAYALILPLLVAARPERLGARHERTSDAARVHARARTPLVR